MKTLSKTSQTLLNLLLIVLSYLCTLSFGQLVSLNGDPNVFYGGTYFGYNISSVLVFAITFILLKKLLKETNKRLLVFSLLIGLLLSFLVVYGAMCTTLCGPKGFMAYRFGPWNTDKFLF